MLKVATLPARKQLDPQQRVHQSYTVQELESVEEMELPWVQYFQTFAFLAPHAQETPRIQKSFEEIFQKEVPNSRETRCSELSQEGELGTRVFIVRCPENIRPAKALEHLMLGDLPSITGNRSVKLIVQFRHPQHNCLLLASELREGQVQGRWTHVVEHDLSDLSILYRVGPTKAVTNFSDREAAASQLFASNYLKFQSSDYRTLADSSKCLCYFLRVRQAPASNGKAGDSETVQLFSRLFEENLIHSDYHTQRNPLGRYSKFTVEDSSRHKALLQTGGTGIIMMEASKRVNTLSSEVKTSVDE